MLIYEDEKLNLFKAMGCFQVGAQSGRNIRDNNLIVHAVCHEARSNGRDIDIALYDVAQCFDSLWLEETINDLYDSGIQNRNLNLIHLGNDNCAMAIRNNHGSPSTKRVTINNIVMQGSVLGPVICSNQISKNSMAAHTKGEVYMYKDIIPIPPLCMVDDIIAIAECNSPLSLCLDVRCDMFAKLKKIAFNPTKCKIIHVGKHNTSCPSEHIVDTQILRGIKGDVAKYLADTISSNQEALYINRLQKARLVSLNVSAMAFEVGFGHHLYEVSVKLFDSMYTNAINTNIETWTNFSLKWVEKFEVIEQQYFRKILGAHPNVPREAIYIEFGVVPFRFILHKKRISYLRIIENRDNDEITK